MAKVTVDNYEIAAHTRYATDQLKLDLTYINESHLVHPHLEVVGESSCFTSKWEELFELNLHRHPWAFFVPPPAYTHMRNRFFSYVLSDNFKWVEHDGEQEDSEEDPEQQKEEEQIDLYRKKIHSKKSKQIPSAILERDRSALLKLLDSIQMLNGFLRDIHGRKLQYQKG